MLVIRVFVSLVDRSEFTTADFADYTDFHSNSHVERFGLFIYQ